MREFPPLPHDPIQSEFDQQAKSCDEWKKFFARKIPLGERMIEFCRDLIYFAASDLAYMDHDVIPRPEIAVVRSIEYVADRLDSDGDLLYALWLQRRHFDGTRECRWMLQHNSLNRMREEQKSGQR
jgi:hypothetical protein